MSARGYSAVGLFNPKNRENIGSALRAAHCFGASMLAIQGKRYSRAATDTSAAFRHLPLLHADDLFSCLPYDCVPVAVELVNDARPLTAYTHPERAFYIFGPEDGSLGAATFKRCRDVLYVPSGCLNLAACVNVVLYDRLLKRGAK